MQRDRIYITFLILALAAACEKKPEHSQEGHGHEHEAMLSLTPEERILANIHLSTAEIKTIFEESTVIGTAAVDERNINTISSRVKGRIDKLFVRSPGTYVKKGDPLYSIYSEELLSYENEYLLAIDEDNNATTQKVITERMVEAARRRLELWTLSQQQINELERSKNVSALVTFYSNRNGYLSELLVREGEYVEAGSSMFRLSGLNDLWIETQFYTSEISYLRQSPSLEVEFEAFPGERTRAEIVYDNPRLEDNTKINLVRIKVNNEKGKYRPGMMAYVYLKTGRYSFVADGVRSFLRKNRQLLEKKP